MGGNGNFRYLRVFLDIVNVSTLQCNKENLSQCFQRRILAKTGIQCHTGISPATNRQPRDRMRTLATGTVWTVWGARFGLKKEKSNSKPKTVHVKSNNQFLSFKLITIRLTIIVTEYPLKMVIEHLLLNLDY